MRLNKTLFLVFLVLYFIAGLSLLITGGVAHRWAVQFAEITGHALVSGAAFIIALGVFIIILSALGFLGAYKNRLSLLQIFIVSLVLILLLQLIAAIVGFTLHNKAKNQLRTKLFSSITKYGAKSGDVIEQWDRLQQGWDCCGVDNYADWTNLLPPPSCCPENKCVLPIVANETQPYFGDGCYPKVRDYFFKYSKALGGVSLFFFFVELVGLVLAIVLLRDLKNNYGSV